MYCENSPISKFYFGSKFELVVQFFSVKNGVFKCIGVLAATTYELNKKKSSLHRTNKQLPVRQSLTLPAASCGVEFLNTVL